MDGLIEFFRKHPDFDIFMRFESHAAVYRLAVWSIDKGRKEVRVPKDASPEELRAKLMELADQLR